MTLHANNKVIVKTISIAAAAVAMLALGTRSLADCDTFVSNSPSGFWEPFQYGAAVVSATEVNNRLQFDALANSGSEGGFEYRSNGWRLDLSADFRLRMDYRALNIPEVVLGEIGLGVGFRLNADQPFLPAAELLAFVSRDETGNRQGIAAGIDGEVAEIQSGPRALSQGTIFIAYHAGLDRLVMSLLGYEAEEFFFEGLRESVGASQAQVFITGFSLSEDSGVVPAVSGLNLWADNLCIDVGRVVPEPATLLFPSGISADMTPSFQWRPVSWATGYRLQVTDATGSQFEQAFTAEEVGAATGWCSAESPWSLAAGAAQWSILATGDVPELEALSDPVSFVVVDPSTRPTPIAPIGNTLESSPAFRWTAVSGATWYQLWVNDSTGTAINRWYTADQVGAGSGECSVTPSAALEVGDGRWWVRAWRPSEGSLPWSSTTFFTIVATSPRPSLIAPEGVLTDRSPEYVWTPVSGATWYQLWVGDSTGLLINRWYTAEEVGATSGRCSILPDESLASGEVDWWVRAWTPSSGNGPWSGRGEFTIAVFETPLPILPSGDVLDWTPTYRWSVVPGATWYQLWVNDPTGTVINRWYTAAEVGASTGECAVSPEQELAEGTGRWWVRAWSAEAGNSAWSDAVDLTVVQPLDWATVIEFRPDPAVVLDSTSLEAIVATGLPWKVMANATEGEMLLVPPGTFLMGCSPSNLDPCDSNETPVHQVALTAAYYLGTFEVTQSEWQMAMGGNPSQFVGPDRPVDRVSWAMIQDFEAATGLRLPSEAEWEYACRAGTTSAFNNGSDEVSSLGSLGWYLDNSGGETRDVGQRVPNSLGFHDMHGNAMEWVEDWYSPDYYASSPTPNPMGPTDGVYRVIRGGDVLSGSGSCRSSWRFFASPEQGSFYYVLGFRAARTP